VVTPLRKKLPPRAHLVPLREAPAGSGTFDRIPRRRAPLVAGVVLALATLAILARTAFWHLLR
jgi:hypothetical protein